MYILLLLIFFKKDGYAFFNKTELILGDPKAVALSPFPLPITGNCTAGDTWRITNVGSLFELLGNIECLWTASITPAAIPLGYNYGRLLAFTNSAILDFFTSRFYQGDFTFETQCFGKPHVISLVKFRGISVSYGIWTINKFNQPIVDGEYYDERESIVMDFSIDLKSLCRGEGIEGMTTQSYSLYKMRPFQTGSWPMRLFIDLLRVVGCDTDGGILLLGRTFMLDPDINIERPAFTVLFFVLKTFDTTILPPHFKCGDSIKLTKSFSYKRHGAADFFSRLDPLRYIKSYYSGTLHNGIFSYT